MSFKVAKYFIKLTKQRCGCVLWIHRNTTGITHMLLFIVQQKYYSIAYSRLKSIADLGDFPMLAYVWLAFI